MRANCVGRRSSVPISFIEMFVLNKMIIIITEGKKKIIIVIIVILLLLLLKIILIPTILIEFI